MHPTPSFWSERPVCVTGGTGFLGWHLVQLLRQFGARVRIVGLRPSDDNPILTRPDVECHFGDIRDAAVVGPAVRGCSVVFHAAGNVAVWGEGLRQMRSIHLDGTRRVLDLCAPECRIVHTSSAVSVGATKTGVPLDEGCAWPLGDLKVEYVHAKRGAELLALDAAKAGRDLVVVNPGYLIGPEDHEDSVMGRLCQRFWKGRLPFASPGGLSVVDVRDVALGHLLAAERGSPGCRYLLTGENLKMPALMSILAEVAGLSPRTTPVMPCWLLTLSAWLAEARSRLVRREPYPSLQQARVSRYYWFYRCDRARRALGFSPRSARESFRDAHKWFRGRGEVKLRGVQRWWMRPAA